MVRCIKGIEHGVKREKTEDGGQRTEFRISNCETGNPSEGWESEGQFRNWKL